MRESEIPERDMDGKQACSFNEQQNTIPTDLDGTNVPAITASLEMLAVNNNNCSSLKRVLRKKPKPRVISTDIPNRRCSLRPKKRTISESNNSEEGIKEYYLDKNIKKKPNNLETIYEESDNANDDFVYMGAKRFKRMLLFKPEPTASKLKKRRNKIKKVFGSLEKIYFTKKRTSMQTLLDKLDGIRVNSPMKKDDELK